MLLVHQTGSVKVGEVVRYTLSYTPSLDRIVPTPPHLCVKIKNSSAVPLRAAYLHGPYTLYTACYSSTFDPNESHGSPEGYGYPQFEPNLKAGGTWNAQLKIPEDIRESFIPADNRRHSAQAGGSATWVIEISSQILFSTSASVNYEVFVGRDEKSIDFGFTGMGGVSHVSPGILSEFQDRRKEVRADITQSKGTYTKAVHLTISDTAAIWNTPALPGQSEDGNDSKKNPVLDNPNPASSPRDHEAMLKSEELESETHVKKDEKQKVHLVLITHGLHSNLGADMLYLKESIDAAARKARVDKSMRKAMRGSKNASQEGLNTEQSEQESTESTAVSASDDDDEGEDEQVIVRGFPGNAIRTERGIQYLGKRLAKYVLAMTYPDQPYIPVKKKSLARTLTDTLSGKDRNESPPAAKSHHESHHNSTIRKEPVEETSLSYQITSISFIGHSLGGLIQTYAIAYIQKHSPEFFSLIKPINFIALATPFLGLSNENPLYVKVALDFGLVGRTGQDLGLTWRAPTVVRNGWDAMIAGIGTEGQRRRSQTEPGTKPLLRILPAGPAHQVLRLFRNRTVYSNVVNDGIVPLRTSCLLFLDWYGLERVDKARRENGIIGTMAGWGWAEITGQNATEQQQNARDSDAGLDDSSSDRTRAKQTDQTAEKTAEVPQPSADAIADSTNISAPSSPVEERNSGLRRKRSDEEDDNQKQSRTDADGGSSSFTEFLSKLKPGRSRSRSNSKSPQRELKEKEAKIYKRSQTLNFDDDSSSPAMSRTPSIPHTPIPRDGNTEDSTEPRPGLVRGNSVLQDNVVAPPKTSLFESAGDILNPPLPTQDYLTNPLNRARTIFHDRVYHPEDIPQPIPRTRSLFRRREDDSQPSKQNGLQTADSNATGRSTVSMKVEEKIARAYHRDLSWRKVLVRLEPDAHNNIVVRRMFANAYGWPVIKHLVDTHFADTDAALLPDTEEEGIERAKPMHASLADGEEVKQPKRRESQSQSRPQRLPVTGSGVVFEGSTSIEAEREDQVPELSKDGRGSPHSSALSSHPTLSRVDSAQWDDRFFDSDEDDDDDEAFESTRSPRHIAMEATSKLAEGLKKDKNDSGSDSAGKEKRSGTKKRNVLPHVDRSPTGTTNEVGLRRSIEEQIARHEGMSP